MTTPKPDASVMEEKKALGLPEPEAESVNKQRHKALLPCPFCGRNNIVIEGQIDGEYIAACNDCDSATGSWKTRDYAGIAWNKRQPAASVERADTERLDWLEKHEYALMCWNVDGEINNGWTLYIDEENPDFQGMTPREAIDAAMKENQP